MTRLPTTAVLLTAALFAAAPAAAEAKLAARGSVEQVQVTGATAGAPVTLVPFKGKARTKTAGSLGGVVFRAVRPAAGYRVRQGAVTTRRITVLSKRPAPPSTKAYDQKLPDSGYGYLTTRDGTKLAINIQVPSGAGPFPTLIEYSGYGYANPDGGESSIAQIATLLGYAVVDVNMRGTGCSGGAFDYFEPLQGLDGYDVIETVARQPWALHHKVGMMGISYGGISQLFVAQYNPPSLAGITPLSVIDSTATTLYPGGLLNTGFALSWAKDRVHDALPASETGGQGWALKRINDGDKICKANQTLHPEAVDLLAKTDRNRYYVPKVADALAPETFVGKIKAPVFLACQWTDEQTGGHCANLADRFTSARRKWFTFTNGTHIDSLDPATFNRWFDFMELYVARRAPKLPDIVKGAAPAVFKAAMGVDGVTLPDDPIQAQPDYASALAAYQALPSVRVLFDNGAGGDKPGKPYAGFERSYAAWPKGTARSFYLGPDGTLTDAAGATGADGFTYDQAARPPTSFTGNTSAGTNGLWTATPPYAWQSNPAGSALSYVSAPLAADSVVVGAGAVEAWIRSSAPSVDLQVGISEVRPDGKEVFVQNGWLRASRRKLDPKKSTLLEPVPSLTKADAKPLPAGKWTKVTIPLYYEGHAYRAGSRVRIVITAPSGDQPVWAFGEAEPTGTATVSLSRGGSTPSRLLLPVVGAEAIPTPLPPCPGLRGEACRDYVPYVNGGA
ncbi:MAG: CocE/NonD family hydrolase [Solirubrobacterales bacterium]|nr:CocE/NonD family hydrolase [Solirubrobacterales bacterium]